MHHIFLTIKNEIKDLRDKISLRFFRVGFITLSKFYQNKIYTNDLVPSGKASFRFLKTYFEVYKIKGFLITNYQIKIRNIFYSELHYNI